MRICSIVARNYLAYARVLTESFLAQHPEGECVVLVVDDVEEEVDETQEPFAVMRPRDLAIERFEGMAATYDVTELSTAVKPWLLEHLLDDGSGRPVAYFDPDIRFYARVDRIEQLAVEHELVLTPHITAPIPDDGKQPGALDLMASGVYNLGFVAMAPGEKATRILRWWQKRLRYDCVIDHALGFFVDQRWFDLVPNTFGGAFVLSDASMNVAYWNLHERTISRDGRWLVNGEPLRFYHFSGFDPIRPHLLSKHQTRTSLSEQPALAKLCREFAEEVQAKRRPEERDIGYGWDSLGDGRLWDQRLRRLYREGEKADAFSLSPFEPEGAEEFLAWIGEPEEEADAAELDGAQQEPWGVNVAGFLQSELGIGEAARSLIGALDAASVPLLPMHGRWRPNSRQEHPFAMLRTEDALFPINVVCVNADVLDAWAAEVGEDFFRDRYTIGFWWWEVTSFPEEWMGAFDLVDEIWVASEHVAEALLPVSPVPITKVPMPVTVPSFTPRSRAELGLPEDFLFLFLFDHHSIFERKNPTAVIEAFKRAFPPGCGRSLVIKSINHSYHPEAHEQLLLAAAEHPDVHIVDRYVSANDKNAMIASTDCYVSLHRAEGYGLTMAEALCMGRPVIATRYGGNLDFMSERNSWLVDFELIPVGQGNDPYPADAEWADPDVDQATGFMQEIAADPARAAARAQLAAAEMADLHSPRGAGRAMRRRLESIHEHRADWPRRPARRREVAELDAPASLVQAGELDGQQPRSGIRGLLRRIVLRLMKPFTAYQRTVDLAMLDAVRQLAESTTNELEQQRRQNAEQAVHQLGALRRHEAQLNEALRELQQAHDVSTSNGHGGARHDRSGRTMSPTADEQRREPRRLG
jgi:glycosyltransferase involved in cell wall biosynthesis